MHTDFFSGQRFSWCCFWGSREKEQTPWKIDCCDYEGCFFFLFGFPLCTSLFKYFSYFPTQFHWSMFGLSFIHILDSQNHRSWPVEWWRGTNSFHFICNNSSAVIRLFCWKWCCTSIDSFTGYATVQQNCSQVLIKYASMWPVKGEKDLL